MYSSIWQCKEAFPVHITKRIHLFFKTRKVLSNVSFSKRSLWSVLLWEIQQASHIEEQFLLSKSQVLQWQLQFTMMVSKHYVPNAHKETYAPSSQHSPICVGSRGCTILYTTDFFTQSLDIYCFSLPTCEKIHA